MKKNSNLIFRYLLWCYKTTKEQLDWIDRKFTQIEVDRYVLKHLQKNKDLESNLKVNEFTAYIEAKEKRGLKEKFSDAKATKIKSEYLYLENRLQATEKAIIHFCGEKTLKEIRASYEQEMTNRILSARDHT